MHEQSLINGLIKKVEKLALEERAKKVKRIRVMIGPGSHLTPDHLLEHYASFLHGPLTAGALLEIEVISSDPFEQTMILKSIDVETK